MTSFRPSRFGASVRCMVAALVCFVGAASASAASPWGRDYFTNTPLTTHDGRQVRFFDDLIKDKVVAINFIFTSCTDSCPLETARLREVQNLLGDRLGKDVFFYSISIDPDTDTPEVLKAYAGKFGADLKGWTFLTGRKADITLLRHRLGLYMPQLEGSKDHNLSLIVGNQKTGRWQKASPFENPYILANHLGSVLHNWKHASPQRNDYANAPTRLRAMSKGEQLFRTRCASCHAIGGDSAASARPMAPDLRAVTERRERGWLSAWIKQPDRMLAEKDPIATALLAQYKIEMPNLRLNDVEVEALLAYLEEESARLAALDAERLAAAASPPPGEHGAHVHHGGGAHHH